MFLLTEVHIQKQIDSLQEQLKTERVMAERTADIYAAGTGYDRSVEMTEQAIAALKMHLACTLNEESYPPVDDFTFEPSFEEWDVTVDWLQAVNANAVLRFGGDAEDKGAWHVRYFINQIVEQVEYRQRARKADDMPDVLRFTRKIEDLTARLARLINHPLTIGDVCSAYKYRLAQHAVITKAIPEIKPTELEAELDRRAFFFLRRVDIAQEAARRADVAAHQAARRVKQINVDARQSVAA